MASMSGYVKDRQRLVEMRKSPRDRMLLSDENTLL
jgi:hypothetical protein